jgi:predicted anti-sigma-YlaC factor YlaD
MNHYSEADLLETYYTQPGQSMPVMMHLAECSECAARYERLERKVRGLAACEHDQPETFWARQRISVMRTIDAQKPSAFARTARIAAAAALALVLGGVVTLKHELARPDAPQVATMTDSAEIEEPPAITSDPWQSDELKDLQPVVAWESWVDADAKKNGDRPL